jgi:hypothetical protein
MASIEAVPGSGRASCAVCHSRRGLGLQGAASHLLSLECSCAPLQAWPGNQGPAALRDGPLAPCSAVPLPEAPRRAVGASASLTTLEHAGWQLLAAGELATCTTGGSQQLQRRSGVAPLKRGARLAPCSSALRAYT